jgi:hypothetical protein
MYYASSVSKKLIDLSMTPLRSQAKEDPLYVRDFSQNAPPAPYVRFFFVCGYLWELQNDEDYADASLLFSPPKAYNFYLKELEDLPMAAMCSQTKEEPLYVCFFSLDSQTRACKTNKTKRGILNAFKTLQ